MKENEIALFKYLQLATSSKSEDSEMVGCCGPKGELEKELAADDSAVVEEVVGSVVDLPPGCKKEVEVKGRKILIINDNGNYLAVNGLCSHYNYPLVNGVYSKGKIRCPLHGACFNMKTGDIEDYPAFDSLHPFQVKKRGNDLVLKTTEKRLGSDRRTKKSWIKETTNEKPIIIVGSGPAGESVLENLRLAGCKTPILMLTKESIPAYDRVLLTKNMSLDAVRLRPDEYYTENKVGVKCNSTAVSFDADAHTVTLSDKSVHPYSKLILALGGAVRHLPNKGGDLKGVHTVRVIEDTKKIYEEAKDRRVVCIGASFIGMEAASALSSVASEIHVVSSSPEPLPVFGVDVGKAVRKFFNTKDVSVHVNAKVDYLEGDEDGKVVEVVLKDGRVIPADVVIVGIGVEPATGWLKNSSVALDSRGYIKVNEKFETNVKNVYAIGDAITAPLPHWGIESMNIQHFQVAQRHGQLAAWSIMGKPQPGKLIPFFWSLFFMAKGIRFAGCSEGYDEIYTRGDVDGFDFVKYYLKDNTVIAVVNSGMRPAAIQFLALCEQDKKLTREDVEKNTTDDWSELLQ